MLFKHKIDDKRYSWSAKVWIIDKNTGELLITSKWIKRKDEKRISPSKAAKIVIKLINNRIK